MSGIGARAPCGLLMKIGDRGPAWTALAVAALDWAGLKSGLLGHSPWILGVLVGAALVLLAARFVTAVLEGLRGGRARGIVAAETALTAGVLVSLVAGTANWALGLQGYIVLLEGEAVPLRGGGRLQEFTRGPLARLEEMNLTVVLSELELLPEGPGAFRPRSHLGVRWGEAEPQVLAVDAGAPGRSGPLRFYQGAFGFAPRIVIVKDEQTVFDEFVPFTTERRGPSGVTFSGQFTIAKEALEVDGIVDLSSLDEGMRGHATLRLAVRREGSPLGRGGLLPGHFADLGGGYGVGFAGLRRWSEVDVSRRNYGAVVLAGAGLALAGAAAWPVASWRSR